MSKAAEDDDTNGGDNAAPVGGEDKRTAMNDTGLHVLKGAIVSVLGARAAVTAGVHFSTATKATLTIEYSSGGKPSEDECNQIQEAVTRAIANELPIRESKMERAAAEAKYKANPVNHTFIYDKFAVKPEITTLSVLEIPNWNVNACSGTHLKSTKELLGLYIQKQKYRKARNSHEFSFVVGKAAVDGLAEKAAADAKLIAAQKLKAQLSSSDKKSAAAAAATPLASATPATAGTDTKSGAGAGGAGKSAKSKSKGSDSKQSEAELEAAAAASMKRCAVDDATTALVESVVLKTLQSALEQKNLLTPNGQINTDTLRRVLTAKVRASLLHFQSATYATGYNSRIERQQNITDRL